MDNKIIKTKEEVLKELINKIENSYTEIDHSMEHGVTVIDSVILKDYAIELITEQFQYLK